MSIYFIHNPLNNTVRISISKQVSTRLATLRSHSGIALTLLGTIDHSGEREIARGLHYKFREYRTIGEWFEVTDELNDYIQENAQPTPKEPADWKTVRLPNSLYTWLSQHKEKTGTPIATAVKIAVNQYKEKLGEANG